MDPVVVWIIIIIILVCCCPICWFCGTWTYTAKYVWPNRCESVETLFDNKDIDLSNKIVLITGANSGIGKEMSRWLYTTNAKIIMGCRNMEKAKMAKEDIINSWTDPKYNNLSPDNLEIIQLDLASFDSINKFIEEFKSRYNKLNILCLNAAIMPTKLEGNIKTKDGFEITFGVNHLGHMLLALKLRDCMNNMNENEYSRLIIISSILHRQMYSDTDNEYGKCGGCKQWCCHYKLRQGFKFDVDNLNDIGYTEAGAGYANSKLLNIMFGREYAKRYPLNTDDNKNDDDNDHGNRTKVVMVAPGVSLQTNLMEGDMFNNFGGWFDSIGQITYTQTKCAITDINNLQNGAHYRGDVIEEPSKTALEELYCKQAWDKSLEMINLKNVSV